MVRRNELACRDEWSRSLWQPREGQHLNGDVPFQRPSPGPLAPAPAENLRSMLNGDMAHAASSQGEDVLLSEARIVSEAHESWEPQQRPFPTGHFDPRTAIFRAREAYRERVRAKSAAERQSAGVEAVIGSPSVADFASPSAEQTLAEPGGRIPDAAAPTVSSEWPVHTVEANTSLSESVEAKPLIGQPILPAIEPISEEGVLADPFTIANEFPLGEPEAEWLATATPDEHADVPVPRTAAFEEADVGSTRVGLTQNEALPEWYRADLPRICRTCRDYRPSAEGQRGWCANSWAFTHRRLVLEDDPAPCGSAIGDWWLPVDDIWLVAADVSSHGRATPLLDRLTGKADRQRRRS
jgi:hypothetical protein